MAKKKRLKNSDLKERLKDLFMPSMLILALAGFTCRFIWAQPVMGQKFVGLAALVLLALFFALVLLMAKTESTKAWLFRRMPRKKRPISNNRPKPI